MSIFGCSVPKFQGTGTPDNEYRELTNSKILEDSNFNEPLEIQFQSIVSGKRTYETLGHYGVVKILVHLVKDGVLASRTALDVLLTYKGQDVILYLHKDKDAVNDNLGYPLYTIPDLEVECHVVDIKPFYLYDNTLFDACIITFITNNYYNISYTIAPETGYMLDEETGLPLTDDNDETFIWR
jgi:hypothetical protein